MSGINKNLLNKINYGNCLDVMPQIADKSIDMILCDLPYGTTQNDWDKIIDLEAMWQNYERIIKDRGAIVLTAAQPFTSVLVMSNIKLFKYDLTWDKIKISGFLNASKMPLRQHEDILVFYKKTPVYNPQKLYNVPIKNIRTDNTKRSSNYGNYSTSIKGEQDGMRHPTSIISISAWNGVIFGNTSKKGRTTHPTQKPVDLFRYLIKTYSNEGDVILDNCIGSGTTAEACILENRNFIGIEMHEDYVIKAIKRLESVKYKVNEKLFTPSQLNQTILL